MSDENYAFWNAVLAVRGEVNRALELARGEKIIGASLEARPISRRSPYDPVFLASIVRRLLRRSLLSRAVNLTF